MHQSGGILGFVAVVLLGHFLHFPEVLSKGVVTVARSRLVLSLFLVGSGLSVSEIKAVGWPPMLLGIGIWFVISVVALWSVVKL